MRSNIQKLDVNYHNARWKPETNHRNLFGGSHAVVCGGMDRLDEAYSLFSQFICECVCWHYVINACGIVYLMSYIKYDKTVNLHNFMIIYC
jgi:hypothetical protein